MVWARMYTGLVILGARPFGLPVHISFKGTKATGQGTKAVELNHAGTNTATER